MLAARRTKYLDSHYASRKESGQIRLRADQRSVQHSKQPAGANLGHTHAGERGVVQWTRRYLSGSVGEAAKSRPPGEYSARRFAVSSPDGSIQAKAAFPDTLGRPITSIAWRLGGSYSLATIMASSTQNTSTNPFDFDLIVKNGIVVTASVGAEPGHLRETLTTRTRQPATSASRTVL